MTRADPRPALKVGRKRPVLLTTRQRDLLYHQLSDKLWCTPMMMGGTDGSHHSRTLTQLVGKGLAERSNRGGHTRNVWQYRRTSAGKKIANRLFDSKKEA